MHRVHLSWGGGRTQVDHVDTDGNLAKITCLSTASAQDKC